MSLLHRQDCSEIRNIVDRKVLIYERTYSQNAGMSSSSSFVDRARILPPLPRNDRFNVLASSFLASKLLLTISRSGHQRIQSASTRAGTLWQRSKRIRGISRSRGGESQAWARSSDSFDRVCWSYFFGARSSFCRRIRRSILISNLRWLGTELASFSIVQTTSPHVRMDRNATGLLYAGLYCSAVRRSVVVTRRNRADI